MAPSLQFTSNIGQRPLQVPITPSQMPPAGQDHLQFGGQEQAGAGGVQQMHQQQQAGGTFWIGGVDIEKVEVIHTQNMVATAGILPVVMGEWDGSSQRP